jgi:hypothetical protein
VGRLVKRGASQFVATSTDTALHVGLARLTASRRQAEMHPNVVRLGKRPSCSMVARNAKAVSGPAPGTVTDRPQVGPSFTSSISRLASFFASLLSPRPRTGATQPGSQAPVSSAVSSRTRAAKPSGLACRS